MIRPDPQAMGINTLLLEIERGTIKIPLFQRDFVWTKEKSAQLLDSILKGYPIGTFILWKTREMLRTVRNVGNLALPDTPAGNFALYVLDGQQRLTSLYASLKGATVQRDGAATDFRDIWVDLAAADGVPAVLTECDDSRPDDFIRFVDLFKGDFTVLGRYPAHHHSVLQAHVQQLQSYQFATIHVNDAPIDVATEIFTRINVTGQRLTVFEIMVAKTYSVPRSFDLAEKTEALLGELGGVDYGTVPTSTVLQVVAAILKGDVTTKTILGLEKDAVIDVWDQAVEAIKQAVDFFRNQYRIPVSRLLPYNALLVPFAYFFNRHPNKPVGRPAELLQDFFWRVSLGARYSATVEQKLAQDLRKIDQILRGEQPHYEWTVDISPEFISRNGYFQTGRSYIKAILCLYAYLQPKAFDDNSLVRLSNDWLKQANSKNYHHVFPRAFLRRLGEPDERVNHIVNIAIVDDFLNKRVIRDKAPSDYLTTFKQQNPSLRQTLKESHLIDLNGSGILDDDYPQFLETRMRAIAAELQKRLLLTPADRQPGTVVLEDYDTVEVVA